MTNKEQENDISRLEFNEGKYSNDYKYLIQKLKSIKKIINLLEQNYLKKEI